jgi:hypothetical protein
MGNETSSRHVVKIGRLVLVAAMAGAWTAAHAVAWVDVGRITHVIVEGEDDGRRVYLAVENSPNPDNCPNGGWVIRVHGHTQKGKLIVAAAMTAKAQGKAVDLLVSGCDDWGRTQAAGINFRP